MSKSQDKRIAIQQRVERPEARDYDSLGELEDAESAYMDQQDRNIKALELEVYNGSQKLVEQAKPIERLRDAIEQFRYGDRCFCQMSIGNPMFKNHSPACKAASAALTE